MGSRSWPFPFVYQKRGKRGREKKQGGECQSFKKKKLCEAQSIWDIFPLLFFDRNKREDANAPARPERDPKRRGENDRAEAGRPGSRDSGKPPANQNRIDTRGQREKAKKKERRKNCLVDIIPNYQIVVF